MVEQLPFTALLNRLFGGPVTALLHALGFHVEHPAAPISNAFAMEVLVFLILTLFFVMVRSRLSVEKPGGIQHTMELINEFFVDQSHEIIGHGFEPFVSFLVTLGLFILISNLIGLIPGFESPTTSPVVPLGCAAVVFIYYHFQGIRRQGLWKYLVHFAGPMPIIAPLMVPIEIASHLARVLSLTIRLYANIFAGDLVTLVFFSLVPIAFPVLFLGLHVFVSFLQAYIFVLLAMVYLEGATAEAH